MHSYKNFVTMHKNLEINLCNVTNFKKSIQIFILKFVNIAYIQKEKYMI